MHSAETNVKYTVMYFSSLSLAYNVFSVVLNTILFIHVVGHVGSTCSICLEYVRVHLYDVYSFYGFRSI